jgi:hypothetical protein
MIENTSVMKQGLPEPPTTHSRSLPRAAQLGLGLTMLGLLATPGSALAQESALVMVADTGGLPPEAARSAFAALLAELRTRQPTGDLRADSARAPAEAFVACELSRCRASLMLRWHAFAVVMVTFVAGEDQSEQPPRVVLDVYDAGGQRTAIVAIELIAGETGSYRDALRVGLESLSLPRPTFAALLVTCDVAGARVFVDDRPLGVVPLGVLRVSPGRHRVHAFAPGHVPHDQTVDVPPGGARVDVRLRTSGVP